MSYLSSITSFQRRILLVLAASSVVALAVGIRSFGSNEQPRPVLAKDEIIVLRTPGGMLEVATLITNEEFRWSTTHTCPIVNCEKLFGATLSEVRVPVHYTYRIPLSAEWKLKLEKDHFDLVVPLPEPKLPAAIVTEKLEIRTDKKWFSPNQGENRESVIRNLGPELNRRALHKKYIDAQRETARKTVVEFAQKWMLAQGVPANVRGYPIRVIFPDDPGKTQSSM